MVIFLALLGSSSAGGFLAISAAVNTQLMKTLRSAIAAAAINFIVGFSVLTLLLVLGILPPYKLELIFSTPWWAFLGGLLGAIFVSLNTLIIPQLGLTTNTIIIVFSQMTISLLIDKLGWFAANQYPITTSKLIGIGLLLLAIVITQLDREYPHRDLN